MAKIKPVLALTSSAGFPVIVDDRGRMWLLETNTHWVRMPDLPDAPKSTGPGARVVDVN